MDTGARGWQMIFRHQASSINVNHCWCSRKTNQATCGSWFAPNPKSSPCQISMLRDFATLEQQCTKMWGCHRKRRREAARKGKQTAKNSSCLTGWKENVSCFFLFLFVLGAKKRIFWEVHSFCSRWDWNGAFWCCWSGMIHEKGDGESFVDQAFWEMACFPCKAWLRLIDSSMILGGTAIFDHHSTHF